MNTRLSARQESSGRLSHLSWSAVVLAFVLGPMPSAQAEPLDPIEVQLDQRATPPPSPAGDRNQALADDAAKFRHFDELGVPGLVTTLVPTQNSVLRDLGGWRSALAAHDVSVQTSMSTIATKDISGSSGQPRDPLRYNGQRATLDSHTGNLWATAGLDSWGLDNAKFIFGAGYLLSSADAINSPDTFLIKALAYYQSFFDRKLEIKAGIFPNYMEYIGLFVGGSQVLANGLSGLVPIQVGLSSDTTATPALNVALDAGAGFYAKFGVQRSVSPKGPFYEIENNGAVGLKLRQDGARALYIGEVGRKRAAAGNARQYWLRAGYLHNDSDFIDFQTGEKRHNHMSYAAADYQLLQTQPAQPYRGIYIGASGFMAPGNVTAYEKSFEARAYAIGLIPSRPADAMNLKVTYNDFSDQAQAAQQLNGLHANDSQLSISAGYSYNVASGVFLLPTLSYIRNPAFIGDFNDALLLQGSLFLSF